MGLLLPSGTYAQVTVPSPGGVAEIERVIVTGSNIPSAQEVGPNPVDTYRPADIEKLGIRNATDLLTNLPQEMGTTSTQNTLGDGDGTVTPSLRGLLSKETLVLIDGKRVAVAASGVGVDINLFPFPMIDHIDILKDGASAVYGTDAVAGVINFFLLHKFRGLEIGGSYGNTNLGASNDMGEREGWIKAGTGDDKTDILVIADFYDRAAIYSRDRDIESNAFGIPWGTIDFRDRGFVPGRIDSSPSFRTWFRNCFSVRTLRCRTQRVMLQLPPFMLIRLLFFPMCTQALRVSSALMQSNTVHRPWAPMDIRAVAIMSSITIWLRRRKFLPADRQTFYGSFTRDICDKYLAVFADFKYTRSFFDAAVPAVDFGVDPFKAPNGFGFSPRGISVPIQNPFNPFTVADATLTYNGVPVPVTTGVAFIAINDQPHRTNETTIHNFCSTSDFAVRWANLEIISRVGIGNWGFVIHEMIRRTRLAVCRPVRPFAERCWIPIRLQRLILFWGSLVVTAKPLSAGSTLLCSVPSNGSCV